MKANQLATLVLRLLGIYCLIQFIPAISITSSAAPIFFSPGNLGSPATMAAAVTILFLGVQLAIGILLIVKSVPWGEKLVPQSNAGEITTVSFEQVQTLAFAVAGAVIFSGALPQLLNSFVTIERSLTETRNVRYPADNFYIWRSVFTAVGTLAKAALGLWMFVGAPGFASFWRSAKNFGTPKAPEN